MSSEEWKLAAGQIRAGAMEKGETRVIHRRGEEAHVTIVVVAIVPVLVDLIVVDVGNRSGRMLGGWLKSVA